jgi:hypothetical protein
MGPARGGVDHLGVVRGVIDSLVAVAARGRSKDVRNSRKVAEHLAVDDQGVGPEAARLPDRHDRVVHVGHGRGVGETIPLVRDSRRSSGERGGVEDHVCDAFLLRPQHDVQGRGDANRLEVEETAVPIRLTTVDQDFDSLLFRAERGVFEREVRPVVVAAGITANFWFLQELFERDLAEGAGLDSRLEQDGKWVGCHTVRHESLCVGPARESPAVSVHGRPAVRR